VRSRRRDSNTIVAANKLQPLGNWEGQSRSIASAGRPACTENTSNFTGNGGCCVICVFSDLPMHILITAAAPFNHWLEGFSFCCNKKKHPHKMIQDV